MNSSEVKAMPWERTGREPEAIELDVSCRVQPLEIVHWRTLFAQVKRILFS